MCSVINRRKCFCFGVDCNEINQIATIFFVLISYTSFSHCLDSYIVTCQWRHMRIAASQIIADGACSGKQKYIKAPHHIYLVRQFTNYFFSHRASNAENIFMPWRHHEYLLKGSLNTANGTVSVFLILLYILLVMYRCRLWDFVTPCVNLAWYGISLHQ